MTALAVVFLVLDGVLLGWAGVAFSRPPFLVLSGLFFVAATTVVVYFRRHLRTLAELGEAQLMLQSEMEVMLDTARAEAAQASQLDSPADK
jgi:hypothetical protein